MKMKIEGIPAPGAYLYTLMTKKRKNLDRMIAREVASGIESGRLLDIGTDPGFIPIEATKLNPNLEVWGIDISKTMVKLARRNAEKAGVDNVRFEVMSAYDLRFPEEYFDLVMSFGALHHFREPLRIFNEVYRVLKAGKEAWIYDLVRDASSRDLNSFLTEVGLPRFPWTLAFRLHGLRRKEWLEDISKFADQSRFEEYSLEDSSAYMKLVLRKF